MTVKGEKCEGLSEYWRGFREAKIQALMIGVEAIQDRRNDPKIPFWRGYRAGVEAIERELMELIRKEKDHERRASQAD